VEADERALNMQEPRHDIPIPTCSAKANPKLTFVLDNLDTRREMTRLLDYLPPSARVDYLRWVCSQVLLPGSGIHPQVAPSHLVLAEQARHDDGRSDRLTLDTLVDVFHFCGNYSIDVHHCLRELERFVKKHGKRPG
jgi:hypothetical protein